MRIGLYDSGIGGISVLKNFLDQYPNHEYIYLGDSARAPYGDRSPRELIGFVHEIFDFMEDQKVELVVSACNTSSMYLNQIDLNKYNFDLVCLFDVMKEYFDNERKQNIALLATTTNIDSQKYQQWNENIHPIKCPKLVPLVEAGDLEPARIELDKYLSTVPEYIDEIILGCTHYPLILKDGNQETYKLIYQNEPNKERLFKIIDPANILATSSFIKSKNLEGGINNKNSVSFASSGDLELFAKQIESFLPSKSSFSYSKFETKSTV